MTTEAAFEAVLLDFYGTLAHATQWISVDEVLAEHGVEMSDDMRRRFWQGELDGVEHDEHSQSRDHYVAWQRQRLLSMLAETDLHPGEYEVVTTKLQEGSAQRMLEAYPETLEVLTTLRDRGLRLAICSNWDWDLAEAVEEAGITDAVDVVVSSAWAGARKPHPRIFEHTLSKLSTDPAHVLFVGDTWGPDVVGPQACGMRPLYLRREGHWPDDTAPADFAERGVDIGSDLRTILELIDAQGAT